MCACLILNMQHTLSTVYAFMPSTKLNTSAQISEYCLLWGREFCYESHVYWTQKVSARNIIFIMKKEKWINSLFSNHSPQPISSKWVHLWIVLLECLILKIAIWVLQKLVKWILTLDWDRISNKFWNGSKHAFAAGHPCLCEAVFSSGNCWRRSLSYSIK